MTVRIAKQPVNLREKLSELERPIGVKGNELMRAETAQDARDLVSAGRKNLIINGDMRVFQRNTNVTDVADGDYCVDRMFLWANASNPGTMNASSSTEAPVGFTNSLLLQVGTGGALAANGYVGFDQRIEGLNISHLGYGTTNAKPITVSFWCRSSEPGTFPYVVRNNDNSRSYIKEFTINSTDTWEYKTLTFPGETSGTWLTTNGIGMRHTIAIDAGTAFSGTPDQWNTSNVFTTANCTNTWADTNSNTFYITGWQVEVGKNATEFEHRSYGEELALCQRYYWQVKNTTGGRKYLGMVQAYSSGATYGIITYVPVEMRANATVGVTGSFGYYNSASGTASSSSPGGLSYSSGRIETSSWGGGSGLSAGDGLVSFWENNAVIYASAEL